MHYSSEKGVCDSIQSPHEGIQEVWVSVIMPASIDAKRR